MTAPRTPCRSRWAAADPALLASACADVDCRSRRPRERASHASEICPGVSTERRSEPRSAVTRRRVRAHVDYPAWPPRIATTRRRVAAILDERGETAPRSADCAAFLRRTIPTRKRADHGIARAIHLARCGFDGTPSPRPSSRSRPSIHVRVAHRRAGRTPFAPTFARDAWANLTRVALAFPRASILPVRELLAGTLLIPLARKAR